MKTATKRSGRVPRMTPKNQNCCFTNPPFKKMPPEKKKKKTSMCPKKTNDVPSHHDACHSHWHPLMYNPPRQYAAAAPPPPRVPRSSSTSLPAYHLPGGASWATPREPRSCRAKGDGNRSHPTPFHGWFDVKVIYNTLFEITTAPIWGNWGANWAPEIPMYTIIFPIMNRLESGEPSKTGIPVQRHEFH